MLTIGHTTNSKIMSQWFLFPWWNYFRSVFCCTGAAGFINFTLSQFTRSAKILLVSWKYKDNTEWKLLQNKTVQNKHSTLNVFPGSFHTQLLWLQIRSSTAKLNTLCNAKLEITFYLCFITTLIKYHTSQELFFLAICHNINHTETFLKYDSWWNYIITKCYCCISMEDQCGARHCLAIKQ